MRVLAALALVACGGSGGGKTTATSTVPISTGSTVTGTTSTTLGDPCIGVVCDGFTTCGPAGECVPFDTCATDGECPQFTLCRNEMCLPSLSDFDGDGFHAALDCDEADANTFPGAPEACNGRDNSCSGVADDADPVELCDSDAAGNTCESGVCVCNARPVSPHAGTIDDPIDLGSVSDTGVLLPVFGNLAPLEEPRWFRYVASDSFDSSCDNFHTRVLLQTPGYTFDVFKADRYGTAEVVGATDWSFALDFRATINYVLVGQCPCSGSYPPPAGLDMCSDDSVEIFVKVEREAGAAPDCELFELEISNGVYDT